MSLRLTTIRGRDYSAALLEEAAGVLSRGGVVVHPTESIHGYGCRYDCPEAVARIRRIKGRNSDKPLILLIPGRSWIARLCREVPESALRLMDLFWPGALTLVLQASEGLREIFPLPGATVAVRHCAHPFTAPLLELADLPLVSTSLGTSGAPVPGDSRIFLELLEKQAPADQAPLIDLAVIDLDLEAKAFPASTIVLAEENGSLRLLREGLLTAGEITERTGMKLARSSSQ